MGCRIPIPHIILPSLLFGTVLFSSCSAVPTQTAEQSAGQPAPQMPKAVPPSAADLASKNMMAQSLNQSAVSEVAALAKTPPVPQQKTQLIKTATLGLRVPAVESVIPKATRIVTIHGGDVFGLQDQIPQRDTDRHKATFQFRVPQTQLDPTLADLAKLGTVETRSIQAQDVATQIVDSESRLKNLRKAEEVVLGIMDRAGSISDVLKVSQELNQIRNEIEQIQGQVQHLKQQVAYSTLTLTLTEAIAQNQQPISLGDRLQETWSQSTHALGETTTGILRMGLWLLVFSPYA
ncbi:MAG: DUF4349 domain-containing protein, partial [Thermosynechococcaceae cyanobacterium]